MPFPPELITMGVGTVVGGILKLSANSQRIAEKREQQMLRTSLAQENIYRAAREFRGDWGFSWTRRTIALMAVIAVIVLPKIIAIYYPNIGVAYASKIYEQLNVFGEPYLSHSWDHARRMILITPVDTHLIAAIIGLFFGSEITKRR